MRGKRDEDRLPQGRTHDDVLRVGETVRRPTGPWTPTVHAYLRHLEEAVALGTLSRSEAQAIRDAGERVLARFLAGWRPFEDWLEWRPDASWSVPSLPEGWDV